MGHAMEQSHHTLVLFTPLLLYFLASSFCSAEVYYVTPSASTPCPKDGSPCSTLSEYADKPNSYFSSSFTTLKFLPGNHTLKERFSLEHLQNISLIRMNSSRVVMVTCIANKSVSFSFKNVSSVTISGLSFVGCGGNNASSVENFLLKDCTLQGVGDSGPGFVMHKVATANIIESHFELNTGNEELVIFQTVYNFRWTAKSKAGGALSVIKSNVSIINCSFCQNTAHIGGAVYAVNNTMVYIESCIFDSNSVHVTKNIYPYSAGGGIYVANSTTVITNTAFTNNTSEYIGGGVVAQDVVGSLTISKSTLVNNSAVQSGGALNVNCLNITLDDCVFVDNKATGDNGYSVNGGAVFIYPLLADWCVVVVKNSFFNRCTASSGGGGGISAYFTFGNGTFITDNNTFCYNRARFGGGLSLLGSTALMKFEIKNTAFCSNTADDGGGMSVVNEAYNPHHQLTIVNTTFSYNYAHVGGALDVYKTFINSTDTTFESNLARDFSSVLLYSSTAIFYGNSTVASNIGSFYAISSNLTFAGYTSLVNNSYVGGNDAYFWNLQEGGALTILQSNVLFRGESKFFNNSADFGGSILISGSTLYVYGPTTIAYSNALTSGGGLYVYQSVIYCMENINITENSAKVRGGGMYGSSATIMLMQHLKFVQNYASLGGGVFLSLNSVIYLAKVNIECSSNVVNNHDSWLNLMFSGNVASSHGADVYVDDSSNSGTCSNSANAPQTTVFQRECFVQSLALYKFGNRFINNCYYPLHTQNIYFKNSVKNSTTIYGGLLDRCYVSPLSEIVNIFFVTNATGVSALLNMSNLQSQDIQRQISSDPVRICFCVINKANLKPNCSYQPPMISVRKGQLFNISLAALDQVENMVPATIRSSLSSGEGGLSEGQAIQNTTNACTYLNYTISSPFKSERMYFYADGPCKDLGISRQFINVIFQSCPVGFEEGENGRCVCASEISHSVTNCSVDNETVLTKENIWVGYNNQSGYIIHQCPYDYCKLHSAYINLNTPNGSDFQCAFDRSGLLCGACKAGLSLSLGSSRCTHCSDYWILLVIPFALAGVVLVVLILMCNLTVAVGTINGLVFYANIIKANQAIFYPATSANPLTVFISWINLDLGIETCFYNGMTAYARTWLQLVFPLYIIFLVILIIQISKYSSKFSRLLTNNPVATLATLILLSYTKLLRAVIATLSVAELKSTNDSVTVSYKRVWSIDPTVEYLKGKHIPLFVAGIVLLLIGLAYTFILVSWQWLHPILTKSHYVRTSALIRSTNHFMDAYHAPYKARHRYWAGLLLLVRVVLYLISAVNIFGNPQVNLASIVFVMVGVFLFQIGTNSIYRKWILNVFEATFFANVTLLATAIVSFGAPSKTSPLIFVTYISIAIALVSFVAILLYHCYEFVLKRLYFRLKGERRRRHEYLQDNIQVTTKTVKSENYSAIREPLDLIDDDPDTDDYRQAAPTHGNASKMKKLDVTRTEVAFEDLS